MYLEAINLNSSELTFYLNLAGVYHEQKQFDKAIEQCQHVLDNTFDNLKKAKAYGRMGFAYQELGDLDKAIESFDLSMLENKDNRIKDHLKQVQALKKKNEEEKYINPELAEEHNEKAKIYYKQGDFPAALKEYNECIRRNPKNAKYLTNRAQCYTRLMSFVEAIKDCDKALELEPESLRAFQRKSNAHLMLKEYHKAIEYCERGLKLHSADPELKETYNKAINLAGSSGVDDEERVKHAYADPEIQKLIMDPRIQQLFKDLKESPKAANEAIMKDEFIASSFKKLVAAGIIKTK